MKVARVAIMVVVSAVVWGMQVGCVESSQNQPAKAGARTAKNDEMVCEYDPDTGSHMSQGHCRFKREVAEDTTGQLLTDVLRAQRVPQTGKGN